MANECLSFVTTTLQAMPKTMSQFLEVVMLPMWSQVELDNIKGLIESCKNLYL
jgi:hypothetical protein